MITESATLEQKDKVILLWATLHRDGADAFWRLVGELRYLRHIQARLDLQAMI